MVHRHRISTRLMISGFFLLAHKNVKETTWMAFLDADWRDFQNIPASSEIPGGSILIDDYLGILNNTGWKRTHIIQAPPSSEHLDARPADLVHTVWQHGEE